jgi:mRNA interferase HigB
LKTHIIKINSIKDFTFLHPDSLRSFNEWVIKVKVADWSIPGDIKKTLPTSDLLGRDSSRVVFNIAGNKYRLIVKYYFGEKQVHLFICWIGTHAAYTKLCKKGQQFQINKRMMKLLQIACLIGVIEALQLKIFIRLFR